MWEEIFPWENMEKEGPSAAWQRTWYTLKPAAPLAAIIGHDGGVGEGKQKSLIKRISMKEISIKAAKS